MMLIISCLLFFAIPVHAQNNIYIAQTATGGNTGADCADAYVYTWFNTSGHYSSSVQTPGTQTAYGPGSTVHICGTITGALNVNGILVSQGNGTTLNPITIKFETGAILTSPAAETFIYPGSNYIIDGGTTCGYVNRPGSADVPCNGTIENTANGTSPTYANQVQSLGISSANGSLEIRNLNIINIYVKTSVSDNTVPGCPGPPSAVHFDSSAAGVSIHNNIMHDACWMLNGDADNVTVYNNDIYNMDHAIGMGYSGVHTGFQFHDNHVHDTAAWDTTSNTYHHDGVHIFYGGSAHVAWNGSLIYNNYFDGVWDANCTAFLAVWDNENGAIFNNVLNQTSGQNPGCANGYINLSTQSGVTNMQVYNNTAIVNGGSGSTCCAEPLLYPSGTAISMENNFVAGPQTIAGIQNTGSTSYTIVDYNTYLNGGTSTPFTPVSGGNVNFSGWQADVGEAHSTYNASGSANVNYLGAPLAGSPALNAGVNLSSLCIQNSGTLPNALCSDIAGNPRPSSGAWTAGAFNLNLVSLTGPGGLPSYVFANATPPNPSPDSPVTFTITNSTAANITVTSVTSSDAIDFPITSNTCSTVTSGGGTCVGTTVSFSPALGDVGNLTSTLTVNYSISGGGTGSVTASLSGTSTAPASTTAPCLQCFTQLRSETRLQGAE